MEKVYYWYYTGSVFIVPYILYITEWVLYTVTLIANKRYRGFVFSIFKKKIFIDLQHSE